MTSDASPPQQYSAREADRMFAQLLEIADDDRADWLTRLSQKRPQLAERLTILAARERSGVAMFDALSRQRLAVLDELAPTLPNESGDPRIGGHYGPWLVSRHIGSGGLAEVYAVQRDDGRYEQQAALKILRAGMFGEHARGLFLRERRLLANLDHPGIVRVIDAGETASGAPWLVMEMAEGTPIDTYCESRQAALPDRLAMIVQAADAVQAAHGRLVLHGDIKPDHIVVHEDTGLVRLLDFGIAQALDESGSGQPGDGFSPRAASPEQKSAQALTVASDIYQLGKVLEGLCMDRQVSPGLAAVIAAATAVDPGDRYPTAAALAADLRAVIEDRAPSRLPDSPLKAIARLARQHKVAAGLAVLLVVGMTGWALTASLAAAAIDRQRDRAVAAADRERRGKEVLLTLFRRADPLEADSLAMQPTAVMAMLDAALADAREQLADDPAMLAELAGWAARAHQRADDLPRALILAREAEVAASHGDSDIRLAAARAYLGYLLVISGEPEDGAALVDQSIELAGSGHEGDPAYLDLLLSAAWAHPAEWETQATLFRRAKTVALAQGSVAAQIEAQAGLGRALANLGQHDEARREIMSSLSLTRTRYGEEHPRMALPLSDLGRLEVSAGNPAAGIERHREALAISERAFGADNATTLSHRNNLALALVGMGDARGASTEFARLLALMPDSSENAGPRAEIAQNLGAALVRQQRYAEAEAPLALAERSFSRLLAPANPRRAFPALTRAEMRLAQGRWADAERDSRAALAQLSGSLPTGHFATETARCRLGMALIGQGRHDEGAPLVRTALAAMGNSPSPVPAEYLAPCQQAGARL